MLVRCSTDTTQSASENRGALSPIIRVCSYLFPFPCPNRVCETGTSKLLKQGACWSCAGLQSETLEETHRRFRRVFGEHTGGYMIDPTLFRLYGVSRVPVVIMNARPLEFCTHPECVRTTPPHDRLGGNISLLAALRLMASEGTASALASRAYCAPHGSTGMKALIPVIIVAFAELAFAGLASVRLAQAQSAADRARALGGALQTQAETAIGEPASASKVPHYAGASPPQTQLDETNLGPKATQEWSSSGTGQMVQGAFSSGPSHTLSGQEDWLQNAKGVISQSAVGAAYQHCRTITTGGSGEAVETQKCSVARAVKAQKTCTRNYVAQVRVWHKYQCFGTRASKKVCTASREFRTAGGPPSGYSGCTHRGSVGRDGGSEIYSCCTRYRTDYLAEVKQCSAMSGCIQKSRSCTARSGGVCTRYAYRYECPKRRARQQQSQL